MLGASSRFTPLLTVKKHGLDEIAYAAYTMCLSGVATYLLDPDTGLPVDGRSAALQKKAAGDPVMYPANNIGTANRWHDAVHTWSKKNDDKVPDIAAVIQPGDWYLALTGPNVESWWQEHFDRTPTRTWGNLLIVEGVQADLPRAGNGLQVAGVGTPFALPPSQGQLMRATAVSAPRGFADALAQIPPTA